MDKTDSHPPSIIIRPVKVGIVNWIGLFTLYVKEVMRFMKVPTQTLFGPVITACLFMMVFIVALSERVQGRTEIDFAQFLAPGLIMMIVLQNAFANTSSSLTSAKVQGNIVDLMMPPLGAIEIIVAMISATLTRCILAAMVCLLTFIGFDAVIYPPYPIVALGFLLLGGMVMGFAGIIAGIWADKYDHLSAITNFVIQPLAFLSGTFYSIRHLPAPFDAIATINPVYMMIDGFRYGLTGLHDSDIVASLMVLSVINILLFFFCYIILHRGYGLKY